MRIDHAIYGTSDLDAATDRIEAELGLAVVAGGRHAGLGTENLIVPLGRGYLELLAIVDAEEAAATEFGRALAQRMSDAGEGLIGWAVAVDEIEPVSARLGTAIMEVAREGLSARLTGVLEALHEPFLPFFISHDPGSRDPGKGADAGGITWIEVAGDSVRLQSWLTGMDQLPLRVVAGAPGVCALGIGERELRTSAPAA